MVEDFVTRFTLVAPEDVSEGVIRLDRTEYPESFHVRIYYDDWKSLIYVCNGFCDVKQLELRDGDQIELNGAAGKHFIFRVNGTPYVSRIETPHVPVTFEVTSGESGFGVNDLVFLPPLQHL